MKLSYYRTLHITKQILKLRTVDVSIMIEFCEVKGEMVNNWQEQISKILFEISSVK